MSYTFQIKNFFFEIGQPVLEINSWKEIRTHRHTHRHRWIGTHSATKITHFTSLTLASLEIPTCCTNQLDM